MNLTCLKNKNEINTLMKHGLTTDDKTILVQENDSLWCPYVNTEICTTYNMKSEWTQFTWCNVKLVCTMHYYHHWYSYEINMDVPSTLLTAALSIFKIWTILNEVTSPLQHPQLLQMVSACFFFFVLFFFWKVFSLSKYLDIHINMAHEFKMIFVKGKGYIWYFKGRQVLWLPVCFLVQWGILQKERICSSIQFWIRHILTWEVKHSMADSLASVSIPLMKFSRCLSKLLWHSNVLHSQKQA